MPLDCTPSVHQLSEDLERRPPIEGEESSRRGGMKSRSSRSFSGLMGGYPGIFQGPRRRLGEETEVADALSGAPEACDDQNLSLSNKPVVSQGEPNFLKIMEKMTQLMQQLTNEVSSREN
ncbi:hypothetical protein O181_022009 [Austropuccinia psidii MF-1]|uniref:Uncharacterized protein n=1 Tax=Austropuccinia psidii MF-1 TaxID=1389203 RepID=A0A9Q3CBT0_9BASI|nr:hypothetical protein [Austropuccinia psidii MF-1]